MEDAHNGVKGYAALQFAKDGIRVNSIHPSFFCDTPLTQKRFNDSGYRKHTEAKIPMGRYGLPDEITYAVPYLASDKSVHVTGSKFMWSGGYTLTVASQTGG